MSFPVINPTPQFFDGSGNPLVSGTIEFRNPTTNALINSYPTADDADARFVAQPRMGDRHVARTAFMPADDQLDVREVDQGIGQRQIAFTGDAIGGIDAMGIERCGQDMGG